MSICTYCKKNKGKVLPYLETDKKVCLKCAKELLEEKYKDDNGRHGTKQRAKMSFCTTAIKPSALKIRRVK